MVHISSLGSSTFSGFTTSYVVCYVILYIHFAYIPTYPSRTYCHRYGTIMTMYAYIAVRARVTCTLSPAVCCCSCELQYKPKHTIDLWLNDESHIQSTKRILSCEPWPWLDSVVKVITMIDIVERTIIIVGIRKFKTCVRRNDILWIREELKLLYKS